MSGRFVSTGGVPGASILGKDNYMTRSPDRRRLRAVGIVVIVGGLTLQAAASATTSDRQDRRNKPSAAQQTALDAGLQVARKGSAKGKTAKKAPNPYLAQLPSVTKADYATWRARLDRAAEKRVRSATYRAARATANRATPAAKAAVVWDEQEPAGTAGSNDTFASAERIDIFGTRANKNNVVRILGAAAQLPTGPTSALATVPEDNGAIPLAGDTGLTAVGTKTTTGVLGDGPHGDPPGGDDSNDFDFYKVTVPAGLTIVADTSASPVGIDTLVAAYDAAGNLLAVDDDGGAGLASLLTFTPGAAGTYYVMVSGFSVAGSLPDDPFDSGSGAGGADTGGYAMSVALRQVDLDNYAVRLRPGDVVGGVSEGTAGGLTVLRPDGSEAVGSAGLDASSLYPPNSPLPGGGNTTLAYVAEEVGWYVLSVDATVGSYSIRLEGYRPGAETDTNQRQTAFIDFEGGRVNTGIWGGPGVRELSPFSAFLAKWGIPANRENAMARKITDEVRENIRNEVRAGSLNPDLQVRVVSSKTNPNAGGKVNTNRVIVGGTIAESGIGTIGIAQFIDPGNYGHEDSALVLLDVLSNPTGPASLNTYLTAASDREAFVAQAVGNVIAHEIGHTVGSYHTDNMSAVVNMMDSGGANFQNLFGVGPDGVGGTADDANVTFTEDVYTPTEGFSGLEDTKNVTAWAYPGS